MKKDRGFTLIELLVTISIIAILMAISIVSFDNLTKNARDGQRKSDLKQIQSALEQSYRDHTVYPSSIPARSWPPYLNQVPTEAVAGNTGYNYVPSCVGSNCTSYCLYATMESSSNEGFAPSPAPCNVASQGNYSVSSP